MPGRLRRRPGGPEHAVDEGPFVSFTDLFIGILFLFLILVAALMLMQQAVVQQEPIPKIPPVQKPPPPPKRDDRPAFRLGIVFNIYQRPSAGDADWTFSRTVRVFRSSDGLCINTVMLRSNLSTAWRPPVRDEDIPTEAQKDVLQKTEPCGLSAKGDHWNSDTETGNMQRVSKYQYDGVAVLHKKEGDVKLDIEYRILGIYDDYFR
jgi:hypothetical protein